MFRFPAARPFWSLFAYSKSAFAFALCSAVLGPPQRAAAAASEVVLATGDAAPDVPGAVIESVDGATLNAAGEIVLWGALSTTAGGVTADTDDAVWRWTPAGPSLVARAGSGGVPAAAGTSFAEFDAAAIADTGRIALRGELALGVGGVSSSDNQGIWEFASGGDAVLARTGVGSPPGVPGGILNSVSTPLRQTPAGLVAATNTLVIGSGDTTSSSNHGSWLLEPTGGALMVREGVSSVPGIPSAQFSTFGKPAVNDQRQIAILGSLKSGGVITGANNVGLFRFTDGAAGELLAREGDAAVGAGGATFSVFVEPRINAAGDVAWAAELGNQAHGVWRHRAASTELVALTGAGNVPGVAGADFASFATPLNLEADVGPRLGGDGQVVFRGELTVGPGGVTADNNQGLWMYPAGSPGQLLARTGSAGVAGVPTANYHSFTNVAANRTGQIAFSATLHEPGVGPPETGSGIWLMDSTGESVLVARAGDMVAGQVAEHFEFVGASGGEDGRLRSFNEFGQLAYQARFATGDATLLYTPDLAWRGPLNGDWDDAANWTLGLRPGEVHQVTIGGDARARVLGPAAPTTVRQLNVGGTGFAAWLELQPIGHITATGGVVITPSGRLHGSGRINGNVDNSASITPGDGPGLSEIGAGRIDIVGDFTQSAPGILSVDLGGTDNSNPAALQYDWLNISGVAELGGLLHVRLLDDFVPDIGDSFGVLTASGGFDSFDTYSLPALPAGRQWLVNPGGATLSLNVVAAASADFDSSGMVDGNDLAAWEAGFGAGPGAVQSQGDATGDGQVDGADFLEWQRQYGAGAAVAAVPEPSAAVLIAVLSAAALAGRRYGDGAISGQSVAGGAAGDC